MNLIQLLQASYLPGSVNRSNIGARGKPEGGSFLELLMNTKPDALNGGDLTSPEINAEAKANPKLLRRLLPVMVQLPEGVVLFQSAQGIEPEPSGMLDLNVSAVGVMQTADTMQALIRAPKHAATPQMVGQIVNLETVSKSPHPVAFDNVVVPAGVKNSVNGNTAEVENTAQNEAVNYLNLQPADVLKPVNFIVNSADEISTHKDYTPVENAWPQKATVQADGPIRTAKPGDGIQRIPQANVTKSHSAHDTLSGAGQLNLKFESWADFMLDVKHDAALAEKHAEMDNTNARYEQKAVFDTAGFIYGNDKSIVKISDTASRVSNKSMAVDVATTIIVNIKKDKPEFEMQLQPEQLGKINVKLSYENGRVNIEITASRPETHSLLASSADEIKAILENNGVRLDGLVVNQGERDYLENQPDKHFGQGGQHNRQDNHKERRDQLNTVSFITLVNGLST